MPELVEVEAYRRLAEQHALGREIAAVEAPDPWYLKGGITADALRVALAGRMFVDTRRHGKLLLLSTSDSGPTLGLRFGMTGRLLVDGTPGVQELWYASNRENVKWDRFAVRFEDGGGLVMRDPRRLGGVQVDPVEDGLGPDALTLRASQLRRALDHSRTALKTRLMDQAHIAGIGNLAADEALWRAGLAPARPAGSLTSAEQRRLDRHLRATLTDFLERGGSHTGELMPQRHPGGVCPKDGTPLLRATVGTRTTWWCPAHQH
ncbi:MAG TPA: DNA-formamidopyrimidine glycosylase family protein [Acidimicrobiales bacterium]